MGNRIAMVSAILLVASDAYAQSVGASIGIGGIGRSEVSARTGGVGVAASLGGGGSAAGSVGTDKGGVSVSTSVGGTSASVGGTSVSVGETGATTSIGAGETSTGTSGSNPAPGSPSTQNIGEAPLPTIAAPNERSPVGLPCSVAPCGGSGGTRQSGPYAAEGGPIATAGSISKNVLNACRETAAHTAMLYGMTDIAVSPLGSTRKLNDGSYRAPLNMRIVYGRDGGYEMREAPVWCQISAEGQVTSFSEARPVRSSAIRP